MIHALVLRFDAPLMSFGTVLVDHHGFTDRFPPQSLLAGMIANALGWDHSQGEKINKLQERIVYAARWDVLPTRVVDYQTVDLDSPKMRIEGWTTLGEPEHRRGGTAKKETHQRYRHYWADGVMTVVLSLKGSEPPNLEDVRRALLFPERPLFIGRKCCLPAGRILDSTDFVEGETIVHALMKVPPRKKGHPMENDYRGNRFEACWPAELEAFGGILRRVTDFRDWNTQLHTGSRYRREGLLPGGGE